MVMPGEFEHVMILKSIQLWEGTPNDHVRSSSLPHSMGHSSEKIKRNHSASIKGIYRRANLNRKRVRVTVR